MNGETISGRQSVGESAERSDHSLVVSIANESLGLLVKSESGSDFRPLRSQVGRPIRLGPLDEELRIPSFFAHLLPDASRRRLLASKLGCSSDDGFGLLRCLGGDLVGDIAFSSSLPLRDVSGRSSIDFDDVTHLSREILALKESSDPVAVQALLCLPGGSQKMSVHVRTDAISTSIGDSRSSIWSGGPSQRGDGSIVKSGPRDDGSSWTPMLAKFEDPRFPGLLTNEALVRRAAFAARVRVPLGLLVAGPEGESVLVVERFDRGEVWDGHGSPLRLAVEDGCQVLGVPASMRYSVSTEELALALSERCAAVLAMRLEFFRLVVFASLVGHGDLHASNVAVLRNARGEWRLAPAFDLASTAIYGDESMALTIGGKTVYSLSERDYLELGGVLGLPADLVQSVCNDLQSRLRKFTTTIVQVKKLTAIEHKVISEILTRLDRLRLA